MAMQTISILGGGNMGFALASRIVDTYSVTIIEGSSQRRTYLAETLPKADCVASPDVLHKSPPDLIVLAIKPQDFSSIASTLPKNAPYLSLLAGIPLSVLKSRLQTKKIARIMPSLTATIGKAVTGYCIDPSDAEDSAFVALTQSVAKRLGTLIVVPEALIPVITALSGSGIAFVFQFIHDLAMAAVSEGLPYPSAVNIIHEMLLGAALYAKEQHEQGNNAVDLITRVCSPAGTTIAGIKALNEGQSATTLQKAVHAVVQRSKDMESLAE